MKRYTALAIIILLSVQIGYSQVVDTSRVFGVTIDAVNNLNAVVTSLSRLCKKPTTRIVFDEFVPASEYQTAVNQIHDVSFIMGELLDSYYMNQYNLSQYVARTNEYVNLLGNKVDIWEVGNEVNGEWLGTIGNVVAKIDTAYKIVKSKGKKTAITLYYNKVCYENIQNEMFRWVNNNLNANIRNGLDYVWVSYYEDDCNGYQPDWQAVFDSLHVLFPNSKIGIGECGTTKVTKKAIYINRYYRMNVKTPKYVGGYFWWYYKQDCVPFTDTLWKVLNNALGHVLPSITQTNQFLNTSKSSPLKPPVEDNVGNPEYNKNGGELSGNIPVKYEMTQNYPNPFNPKTSLTYSLPEDGFVSLKIYDLNGREVKTLVNELKKANTYRIDFDASELSSGVYYYKINANGYIDVKKMIYVK